jgi:hypothetical protein
VIARTPLQDHEPRPGLVVVAGVLYAALAALTQPLTVPATVAWAVPALAALILAGLRTPAVRHRAGADRRIRRTAVAWGTILALVVALELAAWLQQPAYNVGSHDHPTISLLLDPILEPWPARLGAWAVWLWVGWRVVRR